MNSRFALLQKTGILLLIFVLATVIAPFSPGLLAALIPLGLWQFPGTEKLPRLVRWSYVFWWVEAFLGFGLLILAFSFRDSMDLFHIDGPAGPELRKNLSQFFARYSIYELIVTQALTIASIWLYAKKRKELIWVLAAELAAGLLFSAHYIAKENYHWYLIFDEAALVFGGLIVWFSFYKVRFGSKSPAVRP
ncbi:MAG: hypothetical protein JNL01_01610 [Bdellovibrionales bacterium]|nr:hypothetical protein [Bdellovibrionales bacterium]